MTLNLTKAALALGAVLAVGGATSAAERDTLPTAGGSGTTMTLGGKGTAAQAATEDTELARGYHGHYGARYGGYGYGGYRGGYYSSYYRGGYGYGGYTSFSYYRPAYYYAPRVYYPTYYYPAAPVYSSFYYDGCSTGVGFSIGIGGNAVTLSAPALNLGTGSLRPMLPQQMQPPAQPMTAPAAPGDGTFRYDGGPVNPVPVPKADPQPMVPPGVSSSTDLPVSLKPKTTASPYKYKAYGEK